MKSDQNIEEFYDSLSETYTKMILRCVPKYHEMHDHLFQYIPEGFMPIRILELGCGSGLLSQKIIDHFPNAMIDMVDISSEILSLCKLNVGENERFNFINKDFNKLAIDHSSYDLIFSSIAIHHLIDEEKVVLLNKIYDWLMPHGILLYSDQTKGATAEIYQKHINVWEIESKKMGATDEEWDEWMNHQKNHDHHSILNEQISWLQKAGFDKIDVLWRYLLWTVYYARK